MEKKEYPRQIRIDSELYEKGKKGAKRLGLNFSSYVRYLISKDASHFSEKNAIAEQ